MASFGTTDEGAETASVAEPLGAPQSPPRLEAILATAVLIAWVWLFHASMLPFGDLSYQDEFLTLDRTTGFARMGDWLNVFSYNGVTFRKPPLQYWFGAALLENGVDLIIALRAPSMLFALGCLIVTAVLAAQVLPQNPWVAPAAVLLLSSSRRFWISATEALLDTGAIFFAMLALLGTILALRRPVWWYLVALAIGLGTLQKAPVGFAFVFLFLLFTGLTARWHPFTFRSFLTNRHFLVSLGIAFVLSASWYVLQFAQHGTVALTRSFGDQMISRFAPASDGGDFRSFDDVISNLIYGEDLFRWPAIIALAILPWRLKRFDLLPLPLIVLTYAIAITFAGGFISNRYSLYFVPIFAVALTAVVLTLPFRPRTLVITVIALSLINGGPVKPPGELLLFPKPKRADQITILSHAARDRAPGVKLLICNWEREWRIPSGAIPYYGSEYKPYISPSGAEQVARMSAEGRLDGPLRGVCPTALMPQITPYLTDIEVVETVGDYVYFTAGAAPGGAAD